jgi:hypothetical protein
MIDLDTLDAGEGEFSVVEFYDDGVHSYVERDLPAKQAVELARYCVVGASDENSIVKRIIITDGGDYTVFQWERGTGITFPI